MRPIVPSKASTAPSRPCWNWQSWPAVGPAAHRADRAGDRLSAHRDRQDRRSPRVGGLGLADGADRGPPGDHGRGAGHTMTRLLASVTNCTEAEQAIVGGADLIDLKDPVRGALGALPLDLILAIRQHVGGRCPVSATIGDLSPDPALTAELIRATAATGVDLCEGRPLLETPPGRLSADHHHAHPDVRDHRRAVRRPRSRSSATSARSSLPVAPGSCSTRPTNPAVVCLTTRNYRTWRPSSPRPGDWVSWAGSPVRYAWSISRSCCRWRLVIWDFAAPSVRPGTGRRSWTRNGCALYVRQWTRA